MLDESDQIILCVSPNESINRAEALAARWWKEAWKVFLIAASNKKAQQAALNGSLWCRPALVNCKLAASPRFSNLQGGFTVGPNKSARAERVITAATAGFKEHIHIIRVCSEPEKERRAIDMPRARRAGRTKSPALFFTHAPRLTSNHFATHSLSISFVRQIMADGKFCKRSLLWLRLAMQSQHLIHFLVAARAHRE